MSKDKSVAQMQREILANISPAELELSFDRDSGSYFAWQVRNGYPRNNWEASTFEGLIETIYNEVVLECKN